MDRALSAIERGDFGLNAAARSYGIPKATLSRHEKSQNLFANGAVKYHGQSCTLTQAMEQELVSHCLELEAMYFGLRVDDLRRLAFDLAEANGLQHNFNKNEKMAGKKWYYAFMRRHPELSLREPENTSIARAQGFNKPRVESFFEMLGKIFDEEKLTADRLFNMDETSLSTVQDGQKKVIGARGKRRIGAMVSNERGESTTCVVCMSATGFFVPPMLIFKRKRMKPELGNGSPPGTVLSAQEKGWMCNEGFCLWLKHFISVVKPTKNCKVVLILDGHVTHAKNLEAINIARESGVRMVSLPPHTTHRLQPLDVAFFGPLGTYYDEAMRTWMRQHVGRAVTTWQVAELLGEAYGRAASVGIAVSGFKASGLWPLDLGVFSDGDFSAAAVTDVTRSATASKIGTTEIIPALPTAISSSSADTDILTEINISQTDAEAVTIDAHDSAAIAIDNEAFCSAILELHPVLQLVPPSLPVTVTTDLPVSSQVPTEVLSASGGISLISVYDQKTSEDSGQTLSEISIKSFYNKSLVSRATPATSPKENDQIEDNERQICHVYDISPLPAINSTKISNRKRRTTHAADLTSTPYKKVLEATPANKKREARKKLTMSSPSSPKKKRICMNKKKSAKATQKQTLSVVVACGQCGIEFGDASDQRRAENWIKCTNCPLWFHDSCSEVNGLLDDDVFLCANCV